MPRAAAGPGGVPSSTPPNELEIRGEVVLPRRAFDEFVAGGGADADAGVAAGDDDASSSSVSSRAAKKAAFSNARNAASGILLRSRDPAPDSSDAMRTAFLRSRLQFYAYDVVASSSLSEGGGEVGGGSNDDSLSSSSSWQSTVLGDDGLEMRDALTRLGFRVPFPIAIESIEVASDVELDVSDVPNLLNYHHDLMSARDDGDAARSDDAARDREADNDGAASRPDLPYQIDGAVYKLVLFDDRRRAGSSSRAPRWAIAHKFPPTNAVTRLLDVEVQVGRTGALTPVAILEPVYLSGVLVSRASLHNFHFARKMLLPRRAAAFYDSVDEGLVSNLEAMEETANNRRVAGVRKGLSLLVGRAGDVIPQVKKRVFDDDCDDGIEFATNGMISLDDPRTCPACGSPTSYDFVDVPKKGRKAKNEARDDGEPWQSVGDDEEENVDREGGQVLRCSGPQLLCRPRAVNGLAYTYSRAGLDVKGLSKARIAHLMEEGIIRFPSDLFALFGGTEGGDSSQRDGRSKRLMKQTIDFLILAMSHFSTCFIYKCRAEFQVSSGGVNCRLKT
jgi:DNA ligase (NAD+)